LQREFNDTAVILGSFSQVNFHPRVNLALIL
jgi:hypothetical protein